MTRDPSDPKPDPLEAILGPILEVTTDASEDDQRELLADIERRRHLGRLERENAIQRQQQKR